MKFGSLFAGIGGIDLGLERAGMECRWQIENDNYCNRVLAKHWPDVKRYGDIREVDYGQLEPVELVAGGFPCQPVSYAGARIGRDDPRWLWPEFERAIAELQPRYVLAENVPGLTTANDGAAFAEVQADLAALGYDTEWSCIPASAVGAPHKRERLFLVAYADNQGQAHDQKGQPGGGITSERFGAESTFGGSCVPRIFRGRREVRRGWPTEPAVGRVAYGIPDRVDRLRGLGNAVVPAVAERVGRQIMAMKLSAGK